MAPGQEYVPGVVGNFVNSCSFLSKLIKKEHDLRIAGPDSRESTAVRVTPVFVRRVLVTPVGWFSGCGLSWLVVVL
jgi:hypothetical protein